MLRPTLILTLAILAAGCGDGHHRPTAFATCGKWYGGSGIDAAEPRAFDCMARAYRAGCAATDVTIAPHGVDTFRSYRLSLYRSGSRCVGHLVLDSRGSLVGRHGLFQADCGDTYLVGRRTLIFSACGGEGDVDLVRGKACPITIQGAGAPKRCAELGRPVSRHGICVVPETALDKPRLWC